MKEEEGMEMESADPPVPTATPAAVDPLTVGGKRSRGEDGEPVARNGANKGQTHDLNLPIPSPKGSNAGLWDY